MRDPACEVIPDKGWPEAGVISGREAVWDFYLGIAETLGMDSTDAQFLDAGSDKVLIERSAPIRGQASGANALFAYSCLTTFLEAGS